MHAVVVGVGAVGARVARQLHTDGATRLTLVDRDDKRASAVARSIGPAAVVAPVSALSSLPEGVDVVVVAAPGAELQRGAAEHALERAASVVSTSGDGEVVDALLDLDAEAFERGRTVVVGAAMSPGLTCVLARHAASDLTSVEEVHVAKSGTGGPACAHEHHAALGRPMREWRDSAWVTQKPGSGRELCWFPDPVGALDCYRAAVPDAVLLHPAFAGARRLTARVAATRRDRVTARLPMLRPPHAEGQLGAVRVEVRGWRGAVSDARVLGAIDRPAVATAAVASVAARWAVGGEFRRSGAGGLADLVADPVPFLAGLAERGVRAAVFEGASSASPTGSSPAAGSSPAPGAR